MTSLWSIWQWASASNERAVANARTAATECSRRRLERAEVEAFLSQHAVSGRSAVDRSVRVGAAGR